ncbi:unnamed protein product [Mytilus coruscus]|uniref:Uncharacterized protein n=1 Tax=Mytilus coruscus TaxID=42192 RepID=A0A6J8BG32_MYTCO|nr:unnamed protein product [Mytilus coruscus]
MSNESSIKAEPSLNKYENRRQGNVIKTLSQEHFDTNCTNVKISVKIKSRSTKTSNEISRKRALSDKPSASEDGGYTDELFDEKKIKLDLPKFIQASEFVDEPISNVCLPKSEKTRDLKDSGDIETDAPEKTLKVALTQFENACNLEDSKYALKSLLCQHPLSAVHKSTEIYDLQDFPEPAKSADEENPEFALQEPGETIDFKNYTKKFPNNGTQKLTLRDSDTISNLEDRGDTVKLSDDSKFKLDLQKTGRSCDLTAIYDTRKNSDNEIPKKPSQACQNQLQSDCIPSSNPLGISSRSKSFDMFSSIHIDDELKNKLYKSIKDESYTECESLLASKPITDTLPLIALGLAKAVACGNQKMVNIIRSYILTNSSKIVTDFRNKYSAILENTTVWMGTKCSCVKTDAKKYEDEICDNPMPILIVETKTSKQKKVEENFQENFQDFPINVIVHRSLRNNESKTIAERMMPNPHKQLDRVPQFVAKRLFKKHSNLTMVCPSANKSIGFGSKEHKVIEMNCITLFCRIKGIIPYGEHHFPLQIKGVQTDVLEGTSHFTSAVHIGDKIHNCKGDIGTLGGFVKYYGIDTFLTCAHVIFGKSNISNLQRKDIHFNCHRINNDNKPEPVQCTLIRHILKYDTQESKMEDYNGDSAEEEEETSIDAALVLIQMPNILQDSTGACSGVCTNIAKHGITEDTQSSSEIASYATKPVELRIKLNGCSDSTGENLSALEEKQSQIFILWLKAVIAKEGLSSIYLNENFIDSDVEYSTAIALSAFSGEQKKLISLRKEEKSFILVPSHVKIDTNIMYNQFSIQNMDFQEGDSGTCIFASGTGSQEKGCIGMLVGKSTSGECIVTPMKEILKALEVDIKS